MKLVRFLERRLQGHAPKSMLHKWIRTGQVRVNKGRAGPYQLLDAGDIVRLPPFALARDTSDTKLEAPVLGPGLRIHAQTVDYLVLAKSAGLPTQPGSARRSPSANADSVAEKLCTAFKDAPFIPAPAHRLDTKTSGLVLAGKNHMAQRRLHDLFRPQVWPQIWKDTVRRDYLAWVAGSWPFEQAVLLRDNLEQEQGSPFQALCLALPVQQLALCAAALPDIPPVGLPNIPPSIRQATLLLVRLLTGRKHQIRLQLASRGFPVIGDTRYGGLAFGQMLLHAYALALPAKELPEQSPEQPPGQSPEQLQWSLFPEWPAPFMPDPARLFAARELCDTAHLQGDIFNQESST